MAIRNIVYSGSDVLKKQAKPVTNFDENLIVLLEDMYDTMVKYNGIGLAAPQVGILKQVVVLEVDGTKLELINPEIVEKIGSCVGVEGCLSVKNIEGYVTRPETIKVKAFNRLGEQFELKCTGLLCRCICHEIDHLHGILFTDIMDEVYVPKKSKR